MERLMMTAAVLAAVGASGAAAAQTAPALTIDDSLRCAGLFHLYSVMPANQFPGMVAENRRTTASFLDRAKILAERRGESADDHIQRATAFATTLAAPYDAAPDQDARYAVVNSWGPLDDQCKAGAAMPV